MAPPCPDGSCHQSGISVPASPLSARRAATFTGPRLCAAIASRLTFDAHIITTGTGTGSGQLRTAQARHQSARTG